MSDRRVSAFVTWGLFAAWVIHHIEELAPTARPGEDTRPSAEPRLPPVPSIALGSIVSAAGVAAAAADGARTGGHSRFYQAVLSAFGAHSAFHLTAAAAKGGYVPGVITASTVVAPFSWWALRKLRVAGIPAAKIPTTALRLTPVMIVAAGAAGLLR